VELLSVSLGNGLTLDRWRYFLDYWFSGWEHLSSLYACVADEEFF